MLLAYWEETKQPFPLLEFSPALESWSDIYTGPSSCLIVTLSTPDASGAPWQNTIELIIISRAVYTGCRAVTQQIPDSKLLPRSINDILTQISNDFLQSLCCIQRCRHGVSLLLFRRRFPLLFFYPPSLSFWRRSANVRHVHWWALSPRIMSRHALYCWLATSLFWYWPDSFLKKCIPHL